MKTNNDKSEFTDRMAELQQRFRMLEPVIDDSNIKKAFSVMNGMIQEIWKKIGSASGYSDSSDRSLRDIADLYKNAPKMEGAAVNKPLPEGTIAPDFELPDSTGKKIRLSDLKGNNILLVFYPLDWSPGCSQQLDLYQQEIHEFKKRNIRIVGISVDSIYSHGAWMAVRNLEISLLSDFQPKGETAKKYQVYRENEGFTERALYAIDKEGVIRYSHVSPYIHHIPDIYGLYKKLDEIFRPAITV